MKAWIFLLAFALAACGHEHAAKKEELTGISLTDFTEATELFVEFEPLRVGEESTFAAHFTRLADFKPVTEGRVSVILRGGGQPEERFEASAPAAPGIFKPLAKPKAPGKRTLEIALESGKLRASHDLGEVIVFQSTQAALAAQPKSGNEPAAIRFLKEQQWQVDFATAPAGRASLRATVPATATIRGSAAGSAQVTAPVAGQVQAGPAGFPHIGQRIEQGAVLLRIAPKLAADVDVSTLRLAVEKARLRLEHEQRERARLEQLLKEEAIAERRVIAARTEEQLAKAELDAAQRRLAPYAGGDRAGGVLVRAPVSATIVELALAPGTFVNEGQVLAQLADPARLWLDARVAEADAARLGDVQGAWVRAPGLEQPLALEVGKNARLVARGQALDPATRTIPIIFEFQSRLPIGSAVRVEIWTGKRGDALAVPASALVEEGGQTVLFVQRDGESFERRVVATGIRDGNAVEIRSGLKPGERVVTRGAYLVRLAGASPKAAGEGHAH
jgi:membrane fusion protein, heavy metal efflux system